MRFSAAILALAASASAVAVPRTEGDNWNVMVSQYDTLGTTVSAHFNNVAYPDNSKFGSRFTCIIDDKPTPNWCDHNGVSADWDGKILKLSQQVEKPNPATVFGEGEVTLEYSEYNKASYGYATIPVQKAIA